MSGERKRNLKNFFQLLMRYKWHHIAAMIFSVLNSVLVLLQPIFLMKIIDEGITNLDMASLLKNILYFIGIIIVQNICEYFTTYIYSIIGKRFILDLRIRVIKHVESMSGEFFINTDASEIFTIFDDDIDNIEQLASKMIFSVISDICIAIIMCIYLGHLQLELFTAILVIQPIMFIVQKKINRNSNNLAFEARSTLGEIIKQVQEYLLSMIQYIKLNAKNVFWRRYKKSSDEYVHKCIGLDMAYCKSGVLGSLLSGSVACIIFGYGGYKVILGELTLGGLITFNQYSQKLFQPVVSIAQNSTQLKRILVSVDRVFNLLNQENEIIPIEPICDSPIRRGDIYFKKVSFHYVEGKEVFHALECHFMSCSFNGIVGKSGEGKTTFINLLFRLWDIQSGEIEIDNINVKNYNINKLRENIDIVSQEVFLLNDTIKNNLTLLNENISMEKVVTIAKKVGLYDMILDSPKGFDTVVGDNGIKLSGGQKQRLSIARVLLREAQIVIFDEATSSLDNAAQENIIDLIFSLLKNRTVIIIAHRLSAVKRCDNIIVINNGRVTESGNHNELMEMQGEYYALYNAEI